MNIKNREFKKMYIRIEELETRVNEKTLEII